MKYPLSTGGPASLRVQYMLWCCAARLLVPAASLLVLVLMPLHRVEEARTLWSWLLGGCVLGVGARLASLVSVPSDTSTTKMRAVLRLAFRARRRFLRG